MSEEEIALELVKIEYQNFIPASYTSFEKNIIDSYKKFLKELKNE